MNDPCSPPAQRWYVLLSKPRQEALALKHLGYQDYEAWYPLYTHWKHLRSKGWHLAHVPLFPRYLFVRTTRPEQGIGPLRSTLGVSGLVRFGGIPCHVSQGLIDELQGVESAIAQAVKRASTPFLPGQQVLILEGPFAGQTGIVSAQAKDRVAVLLHLLGREKAVQFRPNALGPQPRQE